MKIFSDKTDKTAVDVGFLILWQGLVRPHLSWSGVGGSTFSKPGGSCCLHPGCLISIVNLLSVPYPLLLCPPTLESRLFCKLRRGGFKSGDNFCAPFQRNFHPLFFHNYKWSSGKNDDKKPWTIFCHTGAAGHPRMDPRLWTCGGCLMLLSARLYTEGPGG